MKIKKNKSKNINKIKIMTFGTFDGVHKGHLDFFKQARALKNLVPGQARKSFLIVSIARDKNVFKIKGNQPFFSEKKRADLVKKLIEKKLVDKVVLSGLKNHIPHILKEAPDIIALGYDQKAYVKNLKQDLQIEAKPLSENLLPKIVRLKPYKEKIYKNSLLKR